MEKTMEKIVTAQNQRFVYPGSKEFTEVLANTWDYGNLGVEAEEQR